jgi:hypothetical protein
MANPQIPMQMGGNLPGLENEQNIEEAQAQDVEMDYYEEALGLDPQEVEEEILSLTDDEIINLVDEASNLPLNFQKEIIQIIESYAQNVIFNHYPRNQKLNKEIVDLILKETVNRVGVKLSKYKC